MTKRPEDQLDPYGGTDEARDQAQLEEDPESDDGPERLYMTQAEIKRALEPTPLPPPK